MKKILIILSVFLLCGCTNNQTFSEEKVVEELNKIVTTDIKANEGAKGFKYYKPRDYASLETSDFIHVLVHKGNKFYLNVDANAYYDKMIIKYEEKPELYLSKKIDLDNEKQAYLEIKELNNSYFLVKMLYNYSSIEVSVKENELYDSVIGSMIILSSIKYNDAVIASIINDADIDTRENTYEIRKPKIDKEKTNILDVYKEEAN